MVAELFSQAGAGDYLAADEAGRQQMLLAELQSPRLLFSPFVDGSEQTSKELALFNAAAQIQTRFGKKPRPIALSPTAPAPATCWKWRCC